MMSPIAIIVMLVALLFLLLNLIHPKAEAAPTRTKITFSAIGIFFVGMVVHAATIDTTSELANLHPAATPPAVAATDPNLATSKGHWPVKPAPQEALLR